MSARAAAAPLGRAVDHLAAAAAELRAASHGSMLLACAAAVVGRLVAQLTMVEVMVTAVAEAEAKAEDPSRAA